MTIAGLQKTTLIDYPEKIACTVFTHGCNFCCPFCHNPELVVKPPSETISEEKFFNFLKNRRYLLEGVVITGGEPCLNKDIINFTKRIKKEGFAVKIDTNGSFPDILKTLIEKKNVDYVAMDIKSNMQDYEEVSGGFKEGDKVIKSINILKDSDIDYEFRTTVVRGIHKEENIEKIGELLEGAETFSLQNFKFAETISPVFSKENEFSKKELENFAKILRKYIKNVEIKNIY